jgi:hypothetical protein
MRKTTIATLIAGLGICAAPVAAQEPAAIVESVEGGPATVGFMDYLTPGSVIQLGTHGKLVLSYLKSCWRETIEAGTVTVGVDQSDIKDGRVERTKVPCDGGKMLLSSQQASRSGAFTFRAPPKQPSAPPPQFMLYGLSPLVEMQGGGRLVIERLDGEAEPIVIEVRAQQLLRGAYYDLSSTNTVLIPGAVYRATAGEHGIVFRIHPAALPGPAPVIGRLLRLSPAG